MDTNSGENKRQEDVKSGSTVSCDVIPDHRSEKIYENLPFRSLVSSSPVIILGNSLCGSTVIFCGQNDKKTVRTAKLLTLPANQVRVGASRGPFALERPRDVVIQSPGNLPIPLT